MEVLRDGQPTARLGSGELVGERGADGAQVRNATVRAVTTVRALTIPSWELTVLLQDDPDLHRALEELSARRGYAS